MAMSPWHNNDYFNDSAMSREKSAMEEMKKEQLKQLYAMLQASSISNVFIQSGVTTTPTKPEEPKPNPVLLLLEDL